MPQDLKFRGEPSRLIIGDNNTIRESVTMNLGTELGEMETRVGSDCLFMAYSHVAHDCIIGDRVILANSVALAGHVTIQDRVTRGGLVAVHQCCRIGRYAFLGGGAKVAQDVPPFCLVQGDRAQLVGVNAVGLKRAGFDRNAIRVLRAAFKRLFLSQETRMVALERVEKYLSELKLWDRRNDISRNLSGGMKRRLMIARALVHEPRLLILDEPTAGVDIEIRRSMWSFLQDINANGTTIILTTHYLEEAETLCRNIAIIDKGEIVEHTSMAELLRKLQREVFVLSTREALQQPPELSEFEVALRPDGDLEVTMQRAQSLNRMFAALGERGVTVESMRNKSNRLEELFMNLVEAKQTAEVAGHE